MRKLLNLFKRKAKNRALLGVLLCYNDADILDDTIMHLLNNNHKLIVWDHGSTDETAYILDKYQYELIERKFIPRNFDFYQLYQAMSKNLIDHYIQQFAWISWPDQDEILEGPNRNKSYHNYLLELIDSEYDWIQFNNFNYWLTDKDDLSMIRPTQRVKHYCLFPDCAPRIRSWRASKTNIREFNHNPIDGKRYPQNFNIRHYPMRTKEQMLRRIFKDRVDIKRGSSNYHYNNMKTITDKLFVPSHQLHYDDGVSELNHDLIFNWRTVYGHQP